MPRRTDTRQRMVRTAADLFRAQGYHATGVNQVLAEGGAPKGSMYFHFPGGKEQLAVEAVTLAGADLRDALAAALDAGPSPAEALSRVLGLLGEQLRASGYRSGCPIATVALDATADSEPIRTACEDVYASWQAVLAEHLGDDDLASVALAAVEGALLLARTRRSPAPLDAVRAHLGVLLERPAP
ncbi:TetR/AcrR family transcriptional regulator [Saccharothrix longispora]|uniref:TetR/AcrR family transcriptional repressor of lmrAB and yxaGH operons n=1 Tax=Saccharothrix longispora TaxID=33920 RepID=A0ABU1Q4T6_9PSEU|nr:TetR/AcrR family transcriptional regulator [Saccharothrix longispora]MDR6597910.1 TetR/AcrR family transcriptional repressor of lmrAB and yxaGH operons [Saccharothrix longispora]